MNEFLEFPKIARLTRECTITEKIDGTNASIYITDGKPLYDSVNGDLTEFVKDFCLYEDEGLLVFAGSRTKWININEDNYGFAKWVKDNAKELTKLEVGHHFGEWWGSGCQRGYGLLNGEKRFSLFNTKKWMNNPETPKCCHVVPILYEGLFCTYTVQSCLDGLKTNGSVASPGFMKPEGVVVWHKAGQLYFKKTIEKDDEWKGKSK